MHQENIQFEQAKNKILLNERQRQGIGTLAEKTVHAVLKNYYAPNEDYHEIPIERYVADIYTGFEIMEIQTRQMNKMRGKLETFLPLYPVTIIYPIPREKWLIWIEEETGELSARRKSPAKGNVYHAFPELYKIKMFLKDSNLKLKLVLLDVDEYRLLNGWSQDKKKGSSRYDRIPLRIVEEVDLECARDYMQFVPYELQEEFTVKMFAKAAHIRQPLAQVTVNILHYLGVLEHIGKEGRAYLYRVCE